jgi:hypothetical protein
MTSPENTKSDIELAAEDLFNFAFERADVKWLLARLPEQSSVKPTAVEYELQILKIITVGWALTFYLGSGPKKQPLSERFWKAVYEFSQGLSHTTELMVGKEVDYFTTLKARLDTYVAALEGVETESGLAPAELIGPVFAELCGDRDDLFAFMAGSKMFKNTLVRVKAYLTALDWL